MRPEIDIVRANGGLPGPGLGLKREPTGLCVALVAPCSCIPQLPKYLHPQRNPNIYIHVEGSFTVGVYMLGCLPVWRKMLGNHHTIIRRPSKHFIL